MFPHQQSSPAHLPPRFQGPRPGAVTLQHSPSSSFFQKPNIIINSSRLGSSENIATSSSLKIPPQAPETLSNDSPSGSFKPQLDASMDEQSWQLHPLHGIIHRFGCNICSVYAIHLHQSENQPQFQKLMVLKREQQDALYTLGIKEGRRRQALDDMFLYEERQALRNQLGETVRAVVQGQAERDYLSQQLRLVQDHLTLSQAQTTSLPFANKLGVISTKSASTNAHRSSNSRTGVSAAAPSRFSGVAEAEPQPLYMTAVPARSLAFSTPSIMPGSQDNSRPLLTHSENNAVHTWLNPISSIPDPQRQSHLQDLLDQICNPDHSALTKYNAPMALGSTSPVGRTGSQSTFTSLPIATTESLGLASTPFSHGEHGESSSVTPGLQNPRRDDPVEVWYEYLCLHPKSWPLGVRQDPNTKRPDFLDLKASRIIAQLRPDLDGPHRLTSRRNAFLKTCATFLSVPGAYRQWLNKHKYKIATRVSYTPYVGPASPLTFADVVRHLADCGVGLSDIPALEQWSKNYIKVVASKERFYPL